MILCEPVVKPVYLLNRVTASVRYRLNRLGIGSIRGCRTFADSLYWHSDSKVDVFDDRVLVSTCAWEIT